MLERQGEGRPLTLTEAKGYLDWIRSADALELYIEETETFPRLLIPYMMNDAAEYYLKFDDCRFSRDLAREEDLTGASAFLAGRGTSAALVIRPRSGAMVSVWFRQVYLCGACYRYGDIGHDWRSSPGQEDIRRLVNLVCVLHDKMEYLGPAGCNELERDLLLLAEFGPFRWYSPIDESILDWYRESPEGAEAARQAALSAGDRVLAEAIGAYAGSLKGDRADPEAVRALAELLALPEHAAFIDLIESRIRAASSRWPLRSYGGKQDAENAYQRQRVTYHYKQEGYEGDYPLLYKKDKNGTVVRRVRLVEEQPFTVMEDEGVRFRIFSMARDLTGPGGLRFRRE